MSWKYIFNSRLIRFHVDLDGAKKFVRENTEYQFFTWAGEIYHISGTETGIKVENCF